MRFEKGEFFLFVKGIFFQIESRRVDMSGSDVDSIFQVFAYNSQNNGFAAIVEINFVAFWNFVAETKFFETFFLRFFKSFNLS